MCLLDYAASSPKGSDDVQLSISHLNELPNLPAIFITVSNTLVLDTLVLVTDKINF